MNQEHAALSLAETPNPLAVVTCLDGNESHNPAQLTMIFPGPALEHMQPF
jgi:hypothetical protein